MPRRLTAVLLALCLLLSAVSACAGDEPEDEDWTVEDWGDDALEDEPGDNPGGSFTTMSYASSNGIDTEKFGDYEYMITEDGEGAILSLYKGEETDLVLPGTVNDLPVVGIDVSMFENNETLLSVVIPGSVKTVGNKAFALCLNLKSVVMEEGVRTLGTTCFGGCPELEEVQLPDSLEVLELGAFCNCPKLREIRLGSCVQTIGSRAFYMCAALSRVTIAGGDAVDISEDAFMECHSDLEIIRE